jgi:hypothetical protein
VRYDADQFAILVETCKGLECCFEAIFVKGTETLIEKK